MAIDKLNLATVEKMWRREVEAASTYKHLAYREHDPKRKDILLRLAEQEDKHAARWSERIAAATGRVPDRKEVERGLSWFQRISDPNVVLHRLEQEENKAEAEYEQLMARLSDPLDRQIAEEAMLEERDHAVILRTLAGGAVPTPRSTLESILHRERWHVRGTGWIGDAIYGVNDGLGAVFGIVSGMAGYSRGRALLLNVVSGASGLVGAGVAFLAVDVVPGVRPFVLALSSASLLYIAMSDLIPDLHRGEVNANALRQVVLIAAGIGTIVLFERVLG